VQRQIVRLARTVRVVERAVDLVIAFALGCGNTDTGSPYFRVGALVVGLSSHPYNRDKADLSRERKRLAPSVPTSRW